MTTMTMPKGSRLPKAFNSERAALGMSNWQAKAEASTDRDLAHAMTHASEDPETGKLLAAIFAGSPFLTDCLLAEPATLLAFLSTGPEEVVSQLRQGLKSQLCQSTAPADAMTALRRTRQQAALVLALADLTERWSTEQVINSLSDIADLLISSALSHLLWQAEARNDLALPDPDNPERDCGYVVLAMGKLGSQELNFSSDIDLIVLYDTEKCDYRHRRGPQEGYVRLTRDLVRLLEERSADGYVFRTDLRLRPDPGSMPLAISYNAALTYYESLGQNWERAAMIKARPVAGDLKLGQAFLTELKPFIWRKHLDFLAIQDIHSIKRQINAHRGGEGIAVRGHNIKLGRGGIREIEFFAQTQQLIWGGRDPSIRPAGTVLALHALTMAGHLDLDAAKELTEAYYFLRRLENRLQMVADQQTHSLPGGDQETAELAAFLGYDGSKDFETEVLARLETVERHYALLFEEEADLAGPGNLVFTGGEPDPDTVNTLESMGFSDGAQVFQLIRGWHHGRYRATRSTRAREILTELMPALLQGFSRTSAPDQALIRFDDFLRGLPSGVQLFAMLHARPLLLDLIAEIMGGAPMLAERLGRNPGLLDAVLTPGFFAGVPSRDKLAEEFAELVKEAASFENLLDDSRRWANDHKFQAGVQILRQSVDVDESGRALSDIAGTVLRGLYGPVLDQFAERHGHIPGARAAIIAFGKLGAREMTVASDLDLVFLYDFDAEAEASDGPKPLQPVLYFARLAQRYITALSAQTAEGELYEIDMRLRPSGKSGPLATSLTSLLGYYRGDAWTWEHMALTRARPVAGDPDFMAVAGETIREILTIPRDADCLLIDVAAMRRRIEKEKPAKSLWSVKYLRGGLIDLEFIAQYLQLRHAHEKPEVLDPSTQAAFARLAGAGCLDTRTADVLIEATRLFRRVQGVLRLTVGPAFDADTLPAGLQAVLAREAEMPDFASLRAYLVDTARTSTEIYRDLVEKPAEELEAATKP